MAYVLSELTKDWVADWTVVGPAIKQFIAADPTVSVMVGGVVGLSGLLWHYKRDTYLDEYRDLRQELSAARSSSTDLAQKVKQVFGSPLV